MSPGEQLADAVRSLRVLIELDRHESFSKATLQVLLKEMLRKYNAAVEREQRRVT